MTDGSIVRIAGGTGTGPTALSAYDAALASAGLANYNLVAVSSVLPAGVDVRRVERVPDLGPAGGLVTVVQARASAPPHGVGGTAIDAGTADDADGESEGVAAGVGWATGPGPGLVYEATGVDPDAVEAELRAGLDAGAALREWDLPERSVRVVSADADPERHVAAAVVAAYGRAEPIS